jgi:hypothetical protein
MKTIAPLALLATLAALSSPLMASEATPELTGCAAKQQDIRHQIAQAKAAGNSAQQSGLETALEQSTTRCTDAGLQKERENKVLQARHEVSERQADLDKAVKKGDSEKINTRKEKLAESRKELQEAIDELDK